MIIPDKLKIGDTIGVVAPSNPIIGDNIEEIEIARKLVEDNAKTEDFRRPGHMFPLKAKNGGVLERRGHTEATVDLVKLAGLKECGLCCEIMRDDGTMMRTTELLEFAKKHKLKVITIAQLIEYRKKH